MVGRGLTGRLQAWLAIAIIAAAVPSPALAQGPRFYPDDPLRTEPAPLPIADAQPRALSEVLETVSNSFKRTGERHPQRGVIPAQGVNTLGEVMDGDWYVNRHATRRLTLDELRRGPGDANAPSPGGPWQVLVVKPFGLNPGLLVADAKNDLYLLRFDPLDYPGLGTSAEMVSSRFLHALGYHVAESYLVRFQRPQLVANEEGQTVSSNGRPRQLLAEDIDAFLRRVPSGSGQTYRAVATRLPERPDSLLGAYQMWGTRSDDPNDIVAHEHRRDLRGLFVFAAWLNNGNARAVGTQDILVTTGDTAHIRHFLIDFTKSLGSNGQRGPKQVWAGHELMFPSLGTMVRNMLGFGIVSADWMRADYPGLPEVGLFEAQTFDPDAWKPEQPVPPFENRLPDDTFWAARQVMAFTDDEIRAIVQTGQYSRPAEDWITAALIERRNRIGRTYFARVLPLDRLRIEDDRLAFDDLGVTYGLVPARSYTIDWLGFDNTQDALLPVIGSGPEAPAAARALAEGSYCAVRVHAGNPAMNVTVYLRRRAGSFEVVGIDRAWPGRVIAMPAAPVRADQRVYADLSARQQALFVTYNDGYNAARGSRYSPEEGFTRLSISEQTTFYGITHALMNSRLTDATSGAALGSALDLVEGVDRIAGQYAGRGGDEQFRLYVRLRPDAVDVLGRSREFFRDHENTVYHVGYPRSYRQAGEEPNLQVSVSEDGMRADIDVDYRSSRSPQGLFNGHLTSANSDVRVGDNPSRHAGRWQGLIAWWQDVFGRRAESTAAPSDVMNRDRPDAPPTPLPPDRPLGLTPERVEDAAQEFLTDWLVRRQYDQALGFLSPRAFACLNLDNNAGNEMLTAGDARRQLRRLMEYASDRLGSRPNLTSAVRTPTLRESTTVVPLDHAFRQDFLLIRLTETQARPYLCDQASVLPTGTEYFGVVVQFRAEGGGILGLVWAQDAGVWKLVSYVVLTP